mmetsp:Transcript_50182/g.144310  ORF Transcript_50182/g.144310 Transcript_50182/m.144310 type:complete len:390 (-) Transcript_50182:99-1268(-)|eukprot:CAMPEP_0177260230 /NCGR_PEP_ID=MMETSP0367-20130122/59142_1 /TAXON_ID=447022 ORGANISM="Scrippsiella hangoei-like, Strain SHHI-4" /NCGR_SAMPLE_ID=MMETSP0367 /ASSEMBLY_ACC=CAM_ASM_000362 /LENGTH=389 /DNA_ID=CAMNT_0018714723 /DNA_START=20 /DNA_END=1189 /DNA_ORIENTATION=-
MSAQASPSHLGTSVPTSPTHDFYGGSGRTVDDLVDEILGATNTTSVQGKVETDVWSRARRAHTELRSTLAEGGWKPPHQEQQQVQHFTRGASSPSDSAPPAQLPTSKTAIAAATFLPGEWWRALSDEVLASLIVDSFSGAFVDAFLDGLVDVLQAKEGWGAPRTSSKPLQARLSHCSSAPGGLSSLSRPLPLSIPRRPYDALSSSSSPGEHSPAIWRSGRGGVAGEPALAGGAKEGFVQSGLPRDAKQAWNVQRYHACMPLESLPRRAALMTKARGTTAGATRRAVSASADENIDQRKYVWPMMATNFPDAWEERTRKKQAVGRGGKRGEEVQKEIKSETWHLKVDDEGRTTFPYSLALHKAFLESQSDPKTKAKAMMAAPVRLTHSLS